MQLDLPTPLDTDNLAHELALFAKAGLCICLNGDLGSGKSHFARAFIRALANDSELEVPSPTFALIQTYNNARQPVQHCDFYRISDASEAEETGFTERLHEMISLIEWSQNAAAALPPERIDITLTTIGQGRRAELIGHGQTASIITRMELVRDFLKSHDWQDAERQFLQGDASARRYERLTRNNSPALLMDMPALPDGPPIHNGLPYSRIAHIAETIVPVAAIIQGLRDQAFTTPQILALDSANGLAIVEDLGDRVFSTLHAQRVDMSKPMRIATQALAAMATKTWAHHITLPDKTTHHIKPFDRAAQMIEVSLLPEWYWPWLIEKTAPDEAITEFVAAWDQVLDIATPEHPVWMLRDYHSPNIIWLPERDGIKRIGMIDTQDCLLGHPAYDLVSLLQDARVDIAEEMETELLNYYCALRADTDTHFDAKEFHASYAVLGAQRATKILGIFARLAKRDNKPDYLIHMPRVANALEKNLKHEALIPVKTWFDRYLPMALRRAGGQT